MRDAAAPAFRSARQRTFYFVFEATLKLSHAAVPGDMTAADVPAFSSSRIAVATTCESQGSRCRTENVPGRPALFGAVSNTTSVTPLDVLYSRLMRRN